MFVAAQPYVQKRVLYTKSTFFIISSLPIGQSLQLALVALGGKEDVVLEVEDGLGVTLKGLEVNNKIGLDSEDGVSGQPGVVLGVELCGAALEIGVRNHNVDVSGPHGVAVHQGKQIPRGAVLGQAIGGGVQAVEPVLALLVGLELAAEVVGGLVLRVLEVVLAIRRRLPNVEDSAGDGLAGGDVTNHTVHLGNTALGGNAILEDLAAEGAERSIGRPEGTQDRGRGGINVTLSDDLMGDLVNEAVKSMLAGARRKGVALRNIRLETKDIGDAVGLVTGLLALGVDAANGVDELDTGHPLVNGEFDLTGEVVEVTDQGAEDLAVAGGSIGAHVVNDGLGEVGIEAVRCLLSAVGVSVGGHSDGGF